MPKLQDEEEKHTPWEDAQEYRWRQEQDRQQMRLDDLERQQRQERDNRALFPDYNLKRY